MRKKQAKADAENTVTFRAGGASATVTGDQLRRIADDRDRKQRLIERVVNNISSMMFVNWESWMKMQDEDGKVVIGLSGAIVDTGKVGITIKGRAAQKVEDESEDMWDPNQKEMPL